MFQFCPKREQNWLAECLGGELGNTRWNGVKVYFQNNAETDGYYDLHVLYNFTNTVNKKCWGRHGPCGSFTGPV